MLLFRVVQAGWKAAGENDRVLALYYMASLVFALVSATSIYFVARSELNFSLAGQSLAGRFDLAAVLEFMLRHHEFLSGTAAAVAGVVTLYLLMSIFLAGGTIAIFVTGQSRYDPALFWGNCGYYFSVFVRLMLLSLPFYGVIVLVLFPALLSLLLPVTNATLAKIVALSVSSIPLAMTLILFDFARVNLVVTGERQALSTLWKSLFALFKNFGLLMAFLLVFLAFNAFLYLLYSFLADFLQAPTIAALIALLVLQQAYVLLRLKLRLAYYATIVELHPFLYLRTPRHLGDVLAVESGAIEEKK